MVSGAPVRSGARGVALGVWPLAGTDGRALASLSEYLVRGPIALSRVKVDETESGPRVTLRASRYYLSM